MRFGPLTGWFPMGKDDRQPFRGWRVYASREDVPVGFRPEPVAIVSLDSFIGRLLLRILR